MPIALVIFYAFPASYGHRNDAPVSVVWHQFFELWNHQWLIIFSLIMIIGTQYFMKGTKAVILGPLAVVIVFLMGPLICMTTLNRGYFVNERQYIYYDAHRAILWLALINLAPLFLEKIKDIRNQILVMILVVAVSMPFIFSNKTMRYVKKVMSNAVSSVDHPSKDL